MSAAALPDYRELLAVRLTALLADYRDDELPEAMWQAALGVIERSLVRTREWAWWKARPHAELARLRDQLEDALDLARLAAELQEAANAAEWEEGALARDLAEQAARARGRAQTLPAERARLARKAARESRGSGVPDGAPAVAEPQNGKV